MGEASKQEKGDSTQEKWKREKGKGIWSIWLCNKVSVQKRMHPQFALLIVISLHPSPIIFHSWEEAELYNDIYKLHQKILPLERTGEKKKN